MGAEYVIALLILIAGLLFVMYGYTHIHPLLKTFITISFVMWYLLPITLTILGYDFVIKFTRITYPEFYTIVSKELLYYISILGVFLLFYRSRKIVFTNFQIKKFKNRRRVDDLFFWLSYLFVIIYTVYLAINNQNYLDSNNESNAQGGTLQLMAFFINYLQPFFWIYFLYGSSKLKRNMVAILLFILSAVLIMGGSRIYLLGIVYLFVFVYIREQNKVRKLWILGAIVLFMGVAVAALPYLADQRSDAKADKVMDNGNLTEAALQEVNIKFNSFAYSWALLKYDGEGFAGFNPYLGSILKFVPRVFWNEKPTATSFNSEVSGIPGRRAPYLMGDRTDYFNTGVSPFIVAYWQQGMWTVILSVILNIVMLFFVNRCFYHSSLYIKALGYMMVLFPQLVMLPTYGDNIIQYAVQMILFFFVLLALGVIKLQNKNRNESTSI